MPVSGKLESARRLPTMLYSLSLGSCSLANTRVGDLSRVGGMVMIIPIYQAELCHPSIRGTVTSLQQFMLGIGALSAAWISYGTFF